MKTKTKKASNKPTRKPTSPSKNDHKHLIPLLVTLLKKARGPKKGVNNHWIQRYIKAQAGVQLDRRQVQVLLRDIRIEGMVNCIVGDHHGYYIATNAGMAEGYEKKLISLIKELTELLHAFRGQASKKFGYYGHAAKKKAKTVADKEADVKKQMAEQKHKPQKNQQPLINHLIKDRRTFTVFKTKKFTNVEIGIQPFEPSQKRFPKTEITHYKRGKKVARGIAANVKQTVFKVGKNGKPAKGKTTFGPVNFTNLPLTNPAKK